MLELKICKMEMKSLFRFTINVRKSHSQRQCTSQLVYEDRVLFVWDDRHVSSCCQQHQNCKRAVRVMYPPFFCKRRSSSNPTNKI